MNWNTAKDTALNDNIVNQCDGCMHGNKADVKGILTFDDGSVLVCQKARYQDPIEKKIDKLLLMFTSVTRKGKRQQLTHLILCSPELMVIMDRALEQDLISRGTENGSAKKANTDKLLFLTLRGKQRVFELGHLRSGGGAWTRRTVEHLDYLGNTAKKLERKKQLAAMKAAPSNIDETADAFAGFYDDKE